MPHATRTSRGTHWRRRSALAAVPAMLLAILTSVGSSQAAVDSPFHIGDDDTVPDSTATQFVDDHLGDKELGPMNGSTTKIGVIHAAGVPMLALTNPNGQVDLANIWLDTMADAAGDTWLYFAFERDSNTGSGYVTYEFQKDPEPCDYTLSQEQLISTCNPWENRQPGDFVLVFDQQGNTVTIYLRYFEDASSGDPWVKGDPLVMGTETNLTSLDVAEAKMSTDGFFGEAAVNLTDTVFADAPEGCLTIGNIIPGTVTGNSDTADYKDTVLQDFGEQITISNCGSVQIIKDTDPENGTGTFPYTLSRSGGADVNFDDTDGTTVTGTLTSDGDSDTQTNLIAAGDYTLSEGAVGPEYALTGIQCVTGEGADAVTATVYPDGEDFAVMVGETTVCTITNQLQRGTLKVQKVLVNDDGGTAGYDDFSWSVDGAAATAFADGNEVSTSVLVGTYDVTEPEANTMGYTTTYSGCDDMVITPGSTATCVITNDDDPGTLRVQKVLTNDNGGTAGYDDFSWSTDGGTTSTPFTDGTVVETTVDAGTYDVTEPEANTMGYTTTYSGCDDMVIANGGSATCVITNDDTKASPTGTTVQHWVLQDSLSITGLRPDAPDAGDQTATFRLYSDATCSTQVGSDEAVTVTGGVAATTSGVTVYETGTYYWTVEFDGDQYNNGFTTVCGDEITQISAKDAKDGGRNDVAV